ncbi:MAG TPA: hypothetical protein VNB29_07860 [Chthoniobacterales bacterium]|nr:hypothetical protein [Chthoniobacterales bacterium]
MNPDPFKSLVRLLRRAATAPPKDNPEIPFGLETRVIAAWKEARTAETPGFNVLAVFQKASLAALACTAIAATVSVSALFHSQDPQAHVANYALVASLDR